MTTPVTEDNLISGAVKYLLGIPEVVAAVGEIDGEPMIFPRDMPVNMEERDDVAIVVNDVGPWGSGNDYNTIEPRRLGIQIWAGPIRLSDGVGILEDNETYRRAYSVYKIVDKYLHRVRGGHEYWGSIRSVSSRRFGGYDDYAAPDGNGVVLGTQIYGVELG
jgi:hypothetical protein